MSEKAVMIAARLYEARNAAVFLLGGRYNEVTASIAAQIRDIIAKSPRPGLTPLIVAQELCTGPMTAHQCLAILATGVDMTEQSP